MGLRQISLILDKRKKWRILDKQKTSDYEERNVEIYFADTRGDTYRDSNKPRSAELYVKGLKPTPSILGRAKRRKRRAPEGRGMS